MNATIDGRAYHAGFGALLSKTTAQFEGTELGTAGAGAFVLAMYEDEQIVAMGRRVIRRAHARTVAKLAVFAFALGAASGVAMQQMRHHEPRPQPVPGRSEQCLDLSSVQPGQEHYIDTAQTLGMCILAMPAPYADALRVGLDG